MINYRVENLGTSSQLKEENMIITDTIETFDQGKFVPILETKGNKIELRGTHILIYDKFESGRTK